MECKDLVAFEEEIKELFEAGKIRAPIHLSVGSEGQLIEIFQDIRPQDWVFSTHRNHYHALLKGIPPDWLKREILAGRSMHINSRKHKFMTSSIVGGCLPIAVGIAMAIKTKQLNEHAYIFIGDMASKTGMMHECCLYSQHNNLPITFIIEDNGYSVNTPTHDIWGYKDNGLIRYYSYEREYPHAGVGKFVTF